MAILNVKNLPDALYQRLQERARREHRSVAQEVTHILERVLGERESLSILELQGLGRDLWKRVDASAYVDAERETWD